MSLTLRIPRELKSPNKWQGRHWRYKHRETTDWEQEIQWAMVALQAKNHGAEVAATTHMLMQWAKGRVVDQPAPEKMRVAVTRIVPSKRNFIRDDDNLRFSVKPLLDALKRQGYIKDDSRKWLEHSTPQQEVSPDGEWATVIQIEPAE